MKLEEIRREIDLMDDKLIRLLSRRIVLVKKAKTIKKKLNLSIEDPHRETEVLEHVKRSAKKLNLKQNFIVKLFKEIIKESKRLQKND